MGGGQQHRAPDSGIGANRTAQQPEATFTVAMADLFAACDPGVLGLRAPENCRQFTRAKPVQQGWIAEYRIHTGGECIRALREAPIRTFVVSANEQHRVLAARRSEWSLLRNS